MQSLLAMKRPFMAQKTRMFTRNVLTAPRPKLSAQATAEDGADNSGSGGGDLEAARQLLQRSFDSSSGGSELLSVITGPELRQLVFDKWGRTFDVRLQKRNNTMYLHIMWRFLEQKSFPLTEEEYDEQLSAICEYLTYWGVAEHVRAQIKAINQTPGYTVGGGARAVSIRLDVSVDGLRGAEWF